jgi:hypothetical protein
LTTEKVVALRAKDGMLASKSSLQAVTLKFLRLASGRQAGGQGERKHEQQAHPTALPTHESSPVLISSINSTDCGPHSTSLKFNTKFVHF